MKTALQWKNEFCNKHIINVRGNFMEEFIKKIQDDALESRRLTGNTEKLITPDIIEKARELADKIIVSIIGYEYSFEKGPQQDDKNSIIDLIAAALAEARSVPDIEASDYLIIASNADRMMRIWRLNNPHAKSNSWLENDIGYWICKISLDKQNAVPDGWKLVPVEPTKEMINAIWDYLPKGFVFPNSSPQGLYRTFLSAAPNPPIAAGGEG